MPLHKVVGSGALQPRWWGNPPLASTAGFMTAVSRRRLLYTQHTLEQIEDAHYTRTQN